MFSTQLHAILGGLVTLDPQSTQIDYVCCLARKCCCCARVSNAASYSNRAHMSTARISRHARISGDCPVCLYPLQGRNITKRPCEHMLCTPCYLDGVSMGFKDSSFNADACEQCRNTAFTKTRAGSTLMEHFTASKQLMVATATATLKRKDAPRGPRPRSLGPSAGSARDAGTEERVSKPKSLRSRAKERTLVVA